MYEQHLWAASTVCAPDFPRKATDDQSMQRLRDSRSDFVIALEAASNNGMPGYYSVYSFPRGHPQDGHIPQVDCVFIDLDVANHHYQPNENRDDYDVSFDAWQADMSALLARARMIADAILDVGHAEHFRAVLSGHKGIHLYLDFPPVHPNNGDMAQFKNGLALYGQNVMEWLDSIAGGVNIDPWVDVDASDLARLARHPNTRHHGAVYDDEQRWCVPVSITELADLHVDDYLSLTTGPRPVPDGFERVPMESAHDKLAVKIRNAASSSSSTSGTARRTKDQLTALNTYREETQNDDITLDDVLFLTKNKPCFAAFRERDDAFDHGQQSRVMELSIMGRLLAMDVPIEVIHEFFEPIPGYDEQTTNEILGDLLARDNEYGEFRCVTICGGTDDTGDRIAGQAPQFCLDDDCALYRRYDDLQKRY